MKTILTKDKNAKSLTYKFNSNYSIIDTDMIEALKKETLKLKQTIRICMHSNSDDDLHNMVIAHPFNLYIRPHCNPINSKAYHHIYGDMLMVGLDNNKKEIFRTILSEKNKIIRIPKNLYLYIKILSNVAIFHEIALGPYTKDTTIYPSWAPTTTDSKGVNSFIKEYKDAT